MNNGARGAPYGASLMHACVLFQRTIVGCAVRTERINRAVDDGARGAPYSASLMRACVLFQRTVVGCAVRTERINRAVDDGARGAPYSAVSVGNTSLGYIS